MSRFASHYDLYGVTIALRSEAAEVQAAGVAVLPPGWREIDAPDAVDRSYAITGGASSGCFDLYIDDEPATGAQDLDDLLIYFRLDVRAYVARTSPHFLFVHAGAVGWKGRGVLLPGPSHAGKTTLVAALLRAGATYYSDDYALFDRQGLLHPYRNPLSVRAEQHRVDIPAEALGGVHGQEALRLGLVVFTEYRPGHVWQPAPLSSGQALVRLLANTPAAQQHFRASLHGLRKALEGAACLVGVRGEAEETAQLLLDHGRTLGST